MLSKKVLSKKMSGLILLISILTNIQIKPMNNDKNFENFVESYEATIEKDGKFLKNLESKNLENPDFVSEETKKDELPEYDKSLKEDCIPGQYEDLISLLFALKKGDLEIVRTIIDRQPLFIKKENAWPMRLACWYGHLHIVKFFVEEKGVEINGEISELYISLRNKDSQYYRSKYIELFYCAKESKILQEATKFLRNNKSEIKVRHESCWGRNHSHKNNPLETACKFGHLDIVKYFIEEKNINPRQPIKLKNDYSNLPTNQTIDVMPMICAFSGGQPKIIEYLENLKKNDIKLQEIYGKFTFETGLFNDNNFLQYILKKIKLENNDILKLSYLKDQDLNNIANALVKHTKCIASILTNNECLHKNTKIYDSKLNREICDSGMIRLLEGRLDPEEEKENIIIQFLIKTLQLKREHYAVNFISNMTNTLITFNILSGCKSIKIPEIEYLCEKEGNYLKRRKISRFRVLDQKDGLGDDLAGYILSFSDYECGDDPKDMRVIKKLKSKEYKDKFYS